MPRDYTGFHRSILDKFTRRTQPVTLCRDCKQRPGTPPYLLREATRINALESTVQRMASDLSSSKDQIKEVKELLMRLINPHASTTPNVTTMPPAAANNQQPKPASATPLYTHVAPSDNTYVDIADIQDLEHPACQGGIEHRPGSNSADIVAENTAPVLAAGAISPSWMSGDTIPVTPNTVLQNFTNRMPIGAAVSTEVSGSIGTGSHDLSPRLSEQNIRSTTKTLQPPTSMKGVHSLNFGGDIQDSSDIRDGVLTRRTTKEGEGEIATPRPPREKFDIGFLPRITSDAIAANHLCYIGHPDHGNSVVAEGRTGGSWKSPKQKFGSLCTEGEQMVQIHKIIIPGVQLIFNEDRHPFKTLEEALVKPSGSSVYVKWQTRLLWKKKKITPTSK